MPVFRYEYINLMTKKVEKGTTAAESKKACINSLARKGINPSKVVELFSLFGLEYLFFKEVGAKKCPNKTTIMLFQQLSFFLKSGIQVYTAIELLTNSGVKKMSAAAREILPYLIDGLSLDEAMNKSGLFKKDIIYQVRAGVVGGELVKTLDNLVVKMKREKEMKDKIINIMIYPAFMAIVMVAVLSMMLLFIIPKVATTLTGFGVELPKITLLVMALSDWAQRNFLFVLFVVVAVVATIIFTHRFIPRGRYVLDSFALKIPLFGALFMKTNMENFCVNLGSLLDSGVSLVRSLQVCSEVIENAFIKDVVDKATHLIEVEGLELHSALGTRKCFPPVFLQMLGTGVTSGKLPDMCALLAEMYAMEVEDILKKIMSLAEPALIVIMCLAGGVMAIAMYLPMLSVMDIL